MRPYDAIVIGIGAMGSAALYHLARRGQRVLGIEQFHVAHDLGSAHGQTRIIRRAYFEHPDYVPLLNHAFQLWKELEQQTHRSLIEPVGLILIGPPHGEVITGVRRAASQYDLDIRTIEPSRFARQFPQLVLPPGTDVLNEPAGGFLRVEDCVRAHVEAATQAGAELVTGASVTGWSRDRSNLRVTTNRAEYLARKLVICGGAWAGKLLADLHLPLTVERKVQLWFDLADATAARELPVFAYDFGDRFFYGFPSLDGRSMKMAEHVAATSVSDPSTIDRNVHDEDTAPVQRFAQQHVRCAGTNVVEHSVCMYTMTPDRHFIIDRHPTDENITFAAGFSGHGFKFAPIVGAVLADLALDGRTSAPVDFLSARRFPRASS